MIFSALYVGGCASAEFDDAPLEACQTAADCESGQSCNTATGACESIRPTPANNGVTSNNDPFNRRDAGATDAGGGEVDTGPPVVPCSPACAANEACQDGQCVSACSPACEEPTICTVDGCRIPDCAERGAPCDPSRPSQGGYSCVTIEDPEGGPDTGVCALPCDTPFEVGGCPPSNYCWDVGETTEINVCLSSQCETHADCGTGSCVRFENDFGLCVNAGTLAEGQSCQIDTNGCVQGSFCRRLGSGSNDGVCSRFCDPWAASSDCPGGQACGYVFTSRQGLCTDNLDATGDAPYTTCTTPGASCGDATRCLSATSANFCYKYCRPGASDCQGVMPDGADGACDNFVIPGERTLGLCMLACDSAETNVCGTDAICVGSLCRRTCTTGNEVDDCCGGSTPCEFTCVNNLCE